MTLVLDPNPLTDLSELGSKLVKAMEEDYFVRIHTDACRREMQDAVRAAKNAGISVTQIAEASGLAPEAIEAL